MHDTDDHWQARVDAVWEDDGLEDDERIRIIDALAGERERDDASALYERAGARDAAGREADAEPLYRAALRSGLDPLREVRASIQLASTVRNLGRPDECIELLQRVRDANPQHALDASIAAFLALALIDVGRDREAAITALGALAPRLPEYRYSVTAYVDEIPARG